MPAKRASTAKSASTVMSASTTKRVRGASRSCTAKRLCTSPECRQEKEELAARMERMRTMARSAMVRHASRTTNLHRHLVTSLLGGAATDLPREQILAKKAEVAALKHEIAKSQRYLAGRERLFTHPLNDEGAVMGREKMEELMEENRLFVEAREDEVRQAEREVVTMVLGQEVQEDRRATTEEQEATNEEMETTNEELEATNEEQEATNEELEATTEELEATNEEHVPSIEEQGVMVPVEERQGRVEDVTWRGEARHTTPAGLLPGTKVLGSRGKVGEPWRQGVLEEVGEAGCKVRFNGGRAGVQRKVVALADLALEAVGRVQLVEGSRVVALYDGGRREDRGAWYPARVVEEAGQANRGRAMVRWDDGDVGYVDHEQVRMVLGACEKVVKMVVVTMEVEEGQQVEVLEEGQWVAGKVLEVDCRLARVEVEGGKRKSWVDRDMAGLRGLQGVGRKRRRTTGLEVKAGEEEVRLELNFRDGTQEVRRCQRHLCWMCMSLYGSESSCSSCLPPGGGLCERPEERARVQGGARLAGRPPPRRPPRPHLLPRPPHRPGEGQRPGGPRHHRHAAPGQLLGLD